MIEDPNLAWWIKALITRADTHVYWTGLSCTRVGSTRHPPSTLFKEYTCSLEMFLDLIKRKVVCEVHQERGREKFFHRDSWNEIRKTIDASIPYISIPLSEEAEEENKKYRLPDNLHWYQITVDAVVGGTINFDLALWGYKYQLSGLSLPNTPFYQLADRLRSTIRFRTDWTAFDEAKKSVEIALIRSTTLATIRDDLLHELQKLTAPSASAIESATAGALRLLEKLLRNVRAVNGWAFKDDNLDLLINGLSGTGLIHDELVQKMRLVSKPYRDYVLHGWPLTLSIAKLLLVTTLEVFVGLAESLDQVDRNKKKPM